MRERRASRKRYSRDEWQQIVERFWTSGLTEAAFCKREKLSPTRFAEWQRRLPRSIERSAPFVELLPPEPTATSSGELEITLPGGIAVRWKP